MKIVALTRYVKAVRKLLTVAEREGLELAIAADPLGYPVMP